MELTYESFEKKAKTFCEENNVGKENLTDMQDRHRLHVEMLAYVRSFYPNDPQSVALAQKLCNNYENVFWEKYMGKNRR